MPELRFVRDPEVRTVTRATRSARPRPSTRSSTRRSTASGSPTTTRIALLRSRATSSRSGASANEIRNRKVDPTAITFIVDRNINYTNVCVSGCRFCAFYRRSGDPRDAYLLPKPVISTKIEETLAIGGTGILMQGGLHPDLAIDYYEGLLRSIKRRYRIHLHCLSPPEVQHIARLAS